MLSKFTPDTVTVLMFVPVVAMVNDTVAVTLVAAITLLESTTDGDVSAALKMAENVPVVVLSMSVGAPTDTSFEVPAAMLANAACALVGVVNFVAVKVTAVPPV